MGYSSKVPTELFIIYNTLNWDISLALRSNRQTDIQFESNIAFTSDKFN